MVNNMVKYITMINIEELNKAFSPFVIRIYTGSMPYNSTNAPTGTLLWESQECTFSLQNIRTVVGMPLTDKVSKVIANGRAGYGRISKKEDSFQDSVIEPRYDMEINLFDNHYLNYERQNYEKHLIKDTPLIFYTFTINITTSLFMVIHQGIK